VKGNCPVASPYVDIVIMVVDNINIHIVPISSNRIRLPCIIVRRIITPIPG
jgi:hypothetical protein